jgi:hypothetical protein
VVTIFRSTLDDNMADPVANTGGGLSVNTGQVLLTDVALIGNSAALGAGIINYDTLVLQNVAISGNPAPLSGGGIYNLGLATLRYVTLNGNTAGSNGGGIINDLDALDLTNVTMSGNAAAGNGGGLHNRGIANLTNVTLSGNSANQGGGIFNTAAFTVTLKNSIVADSLNGGSCGGVLPSVTHADRYSLASDTTRVLQGTGSQNGMAVHLGALADNGGPRVGAGAGFPMLTHLPIPPSPAIDGVVGTDFPPTDQRGVHRPVGLGADIGAVGYALLLPTYVPLVLR